MNTQFGKALPVLLLATCGTVFAADGERSESPTYMAHRSVLKAHEMAELIDTSGGFTCDIAFVAGAAQLDPQSVAQIQEIAQMLRDDGDLRIEVALQHSDLGDGPAARRLAQDRAVVLVNTLRAMNISGKRVLAKSSTDPTSVAFNELVRAEQTNIGATESGFHRSYP